MKRKEKLLGLFMVLFTMISMNAFASHDTHYGKMQFTTKGNGKVYFSTALPSKNTGWSTSEAGSTVEMEYSCDEVATNPGWRNFTFEVQPDQYCSLQGVYEDEACTKSVSKLDDVRLTFDSTDKNKPTSYHYYAVFTFEPFRQYILGIINSAPDFYQNKQTYIEQVNKASTPQVAIDALKNFRSDFLSSMSSNSLTDVDVTCLLENTGFECPIDWDYGWSGTTDDSNDGDKNVMTAYQKQSNNDYFSGNFAQMWRTGGDRTLDAGNCYQTIKLAPGKYKLTANLAQTNIDMWLYESFDNKEVKVGNNGVYEIEFVVNSYTEVTVGVKHNSKKDKNDKWVACDDFKLYYSNDYEANLKVSQDKYGTFCAPFEVTIPSGIKAYTVPSLEGAHLNLSEVTTTIPANTPVIVEGADNGYDGNFYGPGTDAETCGTGNLVGLLKDVEIPAGSYVLQTQSGKQAFYKVESAAYGVVNRCYLKADAKAKVLNFNAEETAIEDLSDFMSGNVQSIYSANGAKVNSLQKGMNIVKMMNGQIKKIMVK